MKVYVITQGYGDDELEILGVFSTRQKADESFAVLSKWSLSISLTRISEMDIDPPLDQFLKPQ